MASHPVEVSLFATLTTPEERETAVPIPGRSEACISTLRTITRGPERDRRLQLEVLLAQAYRGDVGSIAMILAKGVESSGLVTRLSNARRDVDPIWVELRKAAIEMAYVEYIDVHGFEIWHRDPLTAAASIARRLEEPPLAELPSRDDVVNVIQLILGKMQDIPGVHDLVRQLSARRDTDAW